MGHGTTIDSHNMFADYVRQINYSDTGATPASTGGNTGTTVPMASGGQQSDVARAIDQVRQEQEAARQARIQADHDAKVAHDRQVADQKAAQAKQEAQAKDAHLSFGEIFKNVCKGAWHSVRGLVCDDKGNFSPKRALITAGVAIAVTAAIVVAEVATAGAATPFIVGALTWGSVALGTGEIAYSGYKAANATTKAESEHAWQGVGEGVLIAATAGVGGGASGALKAADAINATKNGMGALEAAVSAAGKVTKVTKSGEAVADAVAAGEKTAEAAKVATAAEKSVNPKTLETIQTKVDELKAAMNAGDSKKVQALRQDIAELTEGRAGLEEINNAVRNVTGTAKKISSETLNPIEEYLTGLLGKEGLSTAQKDSIEKALTLLRTPGKEAKGLRDAKALIRKHGDKNADNYDEVILAIGRAKTELNAKPTIRTRFGNLVRNTKNSTATLIENPVTSTVAFGTKVVAGAAIANGVNNMGEEENAEALAAAPEVTNTPEKIAADERTTNDKIHQIAVAAAKDVNINLGDVINKNTEEILAMVNTQRQKLIADAINKHGVPEALFDKNNDTAATIEQKVANYKTAKQEAQQRNAEQARLMEGINSLPTLNI